MPTAQNATILQHLSDGQRAAGRGEFAPPPPPLVPPVVPPGATTSADETENIAPPAPAVPAESVAKTAPVRKGSAAAAT